MIQARSCDELSHRQTHDWRTHGHTQAMTIPEGQNWPRVKLVELNISRNVIATWLIKFRRNTFYGPEINGNPIVYTDDLTFEIRARAVRHVIMEHTRELPLEQKLNLHQHLIKWAIPLKDIPICSSTDIYHMCRTRLFVVGKDSVPQKFSF